MPKTKKRLQGDKPQGFVTKPSLFGLDEVVSRFQEVTNPKSEEELVGVLLRHVKGYCEKKFTDPRVVGLAKSPDGKQFEFTLQAKKDGKDIEFSIKTKQQPKSKPQPVARWDGTVQPVRQPYTLSRKEMAWLY